MLRQDLTVKVLIQAQIEKTNQAINLIKQKKTISVSDETNLPKTPLQNFYCFIVD